MNKEIVSNEKLIDEIILKPKNQKIGIVFGGEASGLTNEHISLVSKCVTINTDDNFSSLNLSHAVTVFCYSLIQVNK
jgi:tRNA/rRNA methyltransferase